MNTAEIHDLGNRRYDGPRISPALRFRAIARNAFAIGWRTRLGVKLPLIATVGTTVAAAVVMYVLRSELAELVRVRGARIPKAESILFHASWAYEMSAFIIALSVGCRAIADDLRLGAFQFYFARALRPRDYVVGKLLGLALLIGIPMFAGPVALAVMRLVFAESLAQATQLADILPRAIALGLAGTAAYVFPVAGLSAWVGRRQHAQAAFALYFLLVEPAAFGLSIPLQLPALRLLSVSNDLSVIGAALFDVDSGPMAPPVWAATLALLAVSSAGLALLRHRVRSVETGSLGGS